MEIEREKLTGTSNQVWNLSLANVSESTREMYRFHVNDILVSLDWNSDRLIEEFQSSRSSENILERKRVVSLIETNIREMREQGKSTSYQKVRLSAIKHFFKSHEMEYNGNGLKIKVVHRGQLKVTKEGLRQILDSINHFSRNELSRLMLRSVILVQKDSGLRSSDTVQLNYGHVREKLNDDFIFNSEVQSEKTNEYIWLILGPESVQSIREIINFRISSGEELTDDSPLFINVEGENIGGRISAKSLSNKIGKITKRLNLERISGHSLRKFNFSTLEFSGMPKNWIMLLHGKKIVDSSGVYTLQKDDLNRTDEQRVLEKYQECYPNLAVFGEVVNNGLKKRVNGLEEEVRISKAWVESNKSAFERMKEEIKQLKTELEREKSKNGNSESTIREMILKMKAEGVI